MKLALAQADSRAASLNARVAEFQSQLDQLRRPGSPSARNRGRACPAQPRLRGAARRTTMRWWRSRESRQHRRGDEHADRRRRLPRDRSSHAGDQAVRAEPPAADSGGGAGRPARRLCAHLLGQPAPTGGGQPARPARGDRAARARHRVDAATPERTSARRRSLACRRRGAVRVCSASLPLPSVVALSG